MFLNYFSVTIKFHRGNMRLTLTSNNLTLNTHTVRRILFKSQNFDTMLTILTIEGFNTHSLVVFFWSSRVIKRKEMGFILMFMGGIY